MGDEVVLQNMTTKRWTIKGTITEGRVSEDGSVRSFIIEKENGRTTIRNARHIKFQARKQKNNVSFAENLVEVMETADSDDAADGNDLVTSSQMNLVTAAENSPRRAGARLAGREPLAQGAY